MEDKLSLSVGRSSASRFIYIESRGLPTDWNKHLGVISSVIQEIPPLNFAHNKTIIIISPQTLDDDLNNTQFISKIGRDVIGYFEFKDENFHNVKIQDFPARECFRFNLGEVHLEGFTLKKILDLEKELRKETAPFGEVDLDWSIVINSHSFDESSVKFTVEIQFFGKKEL